MFTAHTLLETVHAPYYLRELHTHTPRERERQRQRERAREREREREKERERGREGERSLSSVMRNTFPKSPGSNLRAEQIKSIHFHPYWVPVTCSFIDIILQTNTEHTNEWPEK